MFNSTLTENARVWFDDLPKETIDSYDDLKKAFLENYLQQKKCIKDPVKIHNIRQRDGESTKEFVRRYKLECRDVKGAPECMKISGFMHGITNLELIKRLHDKIPKSVDEMMRVAFLRGEVAASNRERKKSFLSWKQQEANQKQNFKKGGFRNQQRKIQSSATNDNPVEKRNANKFCEFHGEVGYNTDEFLHLGIQIEEMLKAGKLSHLVKEIKQNNGKEQPKVTKKGETIGKDKATAILMAEIGGHCVQRMYVDGGSASKILYEHCFSILRPEIKRQLIPATTLLIGFSGETIWPIGQIQLLLTIGDEEHSASALINFVVVRSPSPYNGIIGRPGVRKLQAVPLTVHEMLKIPVDGGRINGGRKDKNGNQPRIPGTDYNDRINSHKRRSQQVVQPAPTKLGYIRLEACGHDWRPKAHRGAPFKCTKGMLSDAYKGYHQIQMAKEDEEKTSFITNQGIFCYTKMPFGLRNTRATYQRLVDKAFHKQIGRNLEVYVDNLVIKSRTEDEIVKDIEETFQTLREINMKLNPKKCTFGIEEGMFLGYKVSTRGLKVCPNKVDAVLSLPSPKCLKDVRKLNGKLASLNWFLAKSAEKSLPFLKTLKKCMRKSDFYWTTEAEEEFKHMKQLIAELPMLVAPMEKEELIIYLAAAKETVSAVLMTEWEAKQMPIYFVNRALRGPEVNYMSMEKLVLALVHVSKRLKRPRVLVKGWILADFIVERPEEESPDTLIGEEEELPKPWILFDATNNESEYEALIVGLKITEQMGVTRSENKKADALSNIASTSFAYLSKQVLVEELKEKSISTVEVLAVVEEEGDTWMNPIFKYLMDGTLPAEVKKARVVKRPLQANYVLREIHEGSCSMHAGTRSVVAKALQIGYYWPTMHEDTRKLIRACQDCQVHKPVPRSPQQKLSPITSPWPFYNGLKQNQWRPSLATKSKNSCGIISFVDLDSQEKSSRTMVNNSKTIRSRTGRKEESKQQSEKQKSKARMESRVEDTGKLGPKWEGPYEVTKALGKGAYRLRDRDGKQLPRTWNISNLKKCYIHQM
ncbi:reverse transcriptase domain-containing protein [Tanacetum coccineum]